MLAALRARAVSDVHLLARRGPAYTAFTTKELRELGQIPDLDLMVDPLDLVLLLVIGLLGFAMRRFGWPVAPAVIGLILGPVAETNLRRALAISDGDMSVLVSSPFSIVVLLVAVVAVVGPPLLRRLRRREAVSV